MAQDVANPVDETAADGPTAETGDEASGLEVQPIELEQLSTPPTSLMAEPPDNLGRVMDVSVSLTARVGVVRMRISDVIDLAPGAVIDLERNAGDPIDIVIGDKLIAKGEIVVVDDRYGVRIVEVIAD